MKSILNIFFIILIGSILNSCSNYMDEDPSKIEVRVQNTGEISYNYAEFYCGTTDDGEFYFDELGMCYATTELPNIEDDKYYYARNGYGNSFYVRLENLVPNTLYYARAYAIYDGEVYYSPQKIFTTPDYPKPACSTSPNTMEYLYYTLNFYYIYGGYDDHEYEITGNSSGGVLHLYFTSEPSSGAYLITNEHMDLGNDEARVYGVFGGTMSWLYWAEQGDSVYIENDGTNISVTLCDVHFKEGQSGASLNWDATANLTFDK